MQWKSMETLSRTQCPSFCDRKHCSHKGTIVNSCLKITIENSRRATLNSSQTCYIGLLKCLHWLWNPKRSVSLLKLGMDRHNELFKIYNQEFEKALSEAAKLSFVESDQENLTSVTRQSGVTFSQTLKKIHRKKHVYRHVDKVRHLNSI